MNTKNIKNLVNLQRKMAVVNKYFDAVLPFLGVAFVMVLGFTMFDGFEEILSVFTSISINVAIITATQMAVQIYFGRYASLDLNTVPASKPEKFVSILCVILLDFLGWAVALLVGFGVMCLIGSSYYDMPSSQVLSLSAEVFTDPAFLIILPLIVAGLMMWMITQYVDKKLKYRTRIMMLVCALPIFLFENLPEDIGDAVAITYFTLVIVVAFAWNYHCFKRTQLK